ncbi:predicted protein [Chaetomium globosum CBS 148.51]|uniref:Uncharacterized protein n=1 Tax=Chaetomium globosum (strain ATCC 6205 / CBS 148.51 / DSM 1962 / NBRC 6347 / NRRL 1970) TaxID=306901 RepID=Q2H0J7_CHAGB|nr:uncharacterized protein CHGG_04699 [Chaetomium globosum CBS 148.51]EAQ88080.1 predicted protein [Chaetomium globosum CBS 148.51]
MEDLGMGQIHATPNPDAGSGDLLLVAAPAGTTLTAELPPTAMSGAAVPRRPGSQAQGPLR